MKPIFLYFLLACSFTLFAQREHHADLSYGFGNNSYSISGNAVKNFKLLKSEKLHLGLGARAGYMNGSGLNFITAPAKHSHNQDAIDTIRVKKSHFILVNLNLNASYHFTPQLSLGANFDFFGFSFGNKQSSDFYPSLASQTEASPRLAESNILVKPSRNDFYLIGKNSKGSLFSEVFVRYTFKERYAVKVGYAILTSEYSTQKRVGYKDNYRFRNISGQVMIGIGYHFI